MTLDEWARVAREDGERRGMEMSALVDTLAAAARALRRADWNVSADEGAPDGVDPSDEMRSRGDAAGSTHDVPTPSDEPASLLNRPIRELAALLANGATSSVALTESALAAIGAFNGEVNAFIQVTGDLARRQAEQADRERAAGHARGPLHGIPISLKDLIDVAGVPTTAASRVRQGIVATRHATATARLIEAGAVIVGKTNLHEFAFGTTNEDSAFGPARHPMDPSRSPGGSSGGSAAGILAGMSAASIGTDTGGSIRIPAAFCGLVGLKPGFGEVPTDGVIPLALSLDHVGPLARTVFDAAAIYRVLAGRASLAAAGGLQTSGAAITLGVATGYFLERLEDGVRAAFDAALDRLRHGRAVALRPVEIANAAFTAPVYLLTSFSEAAAYHAATLEKRPADYTPPVRLRLELARHTLGEDYVRAQRGRGVLAHAVDRALAACDAIVLPTVPMVAPRLGQTTVTLGGYVDSVRNATLRLTQLFNVTGHPAITIPAGAADEGLPVGLQLVGRFGETERLLAIAQGVSDALGG